jgi:hypothetical protein
MNILKCCFKPKNYKILEILLFFFIVVAENIKLIKIETGFENQGGDENLGFFWLWQK